SRGAGTALVARWPRDRTGDVGVFPVADRGIAGLVIVRDLPGGLVAARWLTALVPIAARTVGAVGLRPDVLVGVATLGAEDRVADPPIGLVRLRHPVDLAHRLVLAGRLHDELPIAKDPAER